MIFFPFLRSDSEEQREKKSAQVGVDQEVESGSESEEEEATEQKEDEKDDEEKAENGGAETTVEKKKKKKKKKKDTGTENLSDDDDDKEDGKNGGDELDAADHLKFDSEFSGKDSDNSRDGVMMDTGDTNTPGSSGVKRKANSDLVNDFGASKKSRMEVSPALVQSAA